jgi:hypothetical protein
MHRFALIALSIAASGLIAACVKGSQITQGTTTCDPGEQIFCRCLGGEAGTKTCNADGDGFESCATVTGACPIISFQSGGGTFSSVTSGGSSSSGQTSSSSGTGGGTLPLYYPCMRDEMCISGSCPMGYCSQPCQDAKDCKVGYGVCVNYEGIPTCLAGCRLESECNTLYGAASACGFTKTVAGVSVAACANWDSKLKLPPLGSPCTDNIDCDLGHPGVQEVCSLQKCVKGCYTPDDCPINTACSGKGGMLGTCH